MRHPFTISLPPQATRPSFASLPLLNPAIIWKHSRLPENQRIVVLPQRPGRRKLPKPPSICVSQFRSIPATHRKRESYNAIFKTTTHPENMRHPLPRARRLRRGSANEHHARIREDEQPK
jgi:hypothetical protein